MSSEPISNPPSSPTPGVQPPTPESPGLGAGEEAGGRSFSLPPEPGKTTGAPTPASDKPTPMDVARDSAHSQAWSQEEIQDHMQLFKTQLDDAQRKLKSPDVTKNLTPDHYSALTKITDKLNPDLRNVAKLTDTEFQPPAAPKGGGALDHVLNWIGGAQDMMKGALGYASSIKGNPNPADMLRLQMAMHRATERGELFSSVIGSTVSGIKTIMSTQLG
jgi:hypothetical protein